MSNLIHQSHLHLEAANRSRYGQRLVPRNVLRRAEEEAHEAVVCAVRAQGTAYVTHVALSHLGELSRLEAQVINAVPLEDMAGRIKAESRARLLVDNYTAVVAAEISRRAW